MGTGRSEGRTTGIIFDVFGICPCCGEIFNLSQSVIRLRRRPVKLPRYDHLLDAQGLIDDKEQEVERVEGRYGERLGALNGEGR